MERETETKRGEIRTRDPQEQSRTVPGGKNGQHCPFRKDAPLRIISHHGLYPHAHTSVSSLIIFLQSNDLDSITLGQLKAMVNSAPKPKARTSPPFNPDYTS
jgi:hypothetical protein